MPRAQGAFGVSGLGRSCPGRFQTRSLTLADRHTVGASIALNTMLPSSEDSHSRFVKNISKSGASGLIFWRIWEFPKIRDT